uniref:glycoside hydrolase family 97 N-terminal domain-containing protein n=1 Tax=Psychrobacter sp. CAL346-MNA-CIBAN-0220 TaxID=3140457 RepID=UPI00332B2AA9
TVQSPDGNIKIIISDEQSTPSYSINFKNKTVINNSALGFEFKQHAPFSNSFKITTVQQQSTNTQWQQPCGERQTVVDQHNEVTVT